MNTPLVETPVETPPYPAQHAATGATFATRPLFRARMNNTETIVTLLNGLALAKDQVVTVTIVPAGIKFTAERNKAIRARAYLKRPLFREYSLLSQQQQQQPLSSQPQAKQQLRSYTPLTAAAATEEDSDPLRPPPPPVTFALSLTMLLECLQVFGTGADCVHLHMEYATQGAPLRLLLEDRGIVTQCEIRTIDMPPETDFMFRETQIVARAVLQSVWLKNTFADLDVAGGVDVRIHVMEHAPFISMAVVGDAIECKVDFSSIETPSAAAAANRKSGVAARTTARATGAAACGSAPDPIVSEFSCSREVVHLYPIVLMRSCFRNVTIKATQTTLCVNEAGTISVQHCIPTLLRAGQQHYSAARGGGVDGAGGGMAGAAATSSSTINNWVEFTVLAQRPRQ